MAMLPNGVARIASSKMRDEASFAQYIAVGVVADGARARDFAEVGRNPSRSR